MNLSNATVSLGFMPVTLVGNTTIGGSGQIISLGYTSGSSIVSTGAATIGSNITIRAASGTLLVSSPQSLTNFGTLVVADAAGSASLTVSGSSFTNSGWVIAASGATLTLGGNIAALGSFSGSAGSVVRIAGTLSNTGSTLLLSSPAQSLVLAGGKFDGGTISTSGGAILSTTGGTLKSLSLDSDLVFNPVTALSFDSGVSLLNHHVIDVQNTTTISPVINVANTQTLDGNGEIVFDGTKDSTIGAASGANYTIGQGIFIHSGTPRQERCPAEFPAPTAA